MIFTTFFNILIFFLLSSSNKGANPMRPFDLALMVSGLVLIVMMSEFVSLGSFLNCFLDFVAANEASCMITLR